MSKDHPILAYRLFYNMSVQDFAKLVGYTRQWIHRFETGADDVSMRAARRIESRTEGEITVQELADWNKAA